MGNNISSHFDTDLAHFTPRQQEACNMIDKGGKKYILYGGALGGGKSYFLRWVGYRLLLSYYARYGLENVCIMLACEDFPSLKDRQLVKIAREWPEWMGTSFTDHKEYGRAFILPPEYGSGVICFRNLDDASKYQSAEFAAILVDELTKNTIDTFHFLRTRLRWPGIPDLECPFIGATNPGGPGHNFVKSMWVDKSFPDEFRHPVDYTDTFGYVPSKAEDNPYLDPGYWSMLHTLPPHMRDAFRDGSWNLFVGQAFQEFDPVAITITGNPPIPDHAPLYMTMDWGFGAPFSIGWWWVDADGRVYRFDEWYGWNGSPNQGLRLSDSDMAEQIKKKEEVMGISGRPIIRIAGPDCFQKRPDFRGGGQGPSTAEIFAHFGLFLTRGDPTRHLKIRQFRERIRKPDDGSKPMLLAYSHCHHFFRTIPTLIVAAHDPEDILTTGEDHVYDEVCHICMARPTSLKDHRPEHKTMADRFIDEIEKPAGNQYDDWDKYFIYHESSDPFQIYSDVRD